MIPKVEQKGQYTNFDIRGMEDGESVIVEKVFVEGKQSLSKFQQEGKPPVYNYSCKVKVGDVEASMWLKEREHEAFKECGGVGDKIKISCKEEKYTFKGQKKIKNVYTFTLVE